MKTNDNTNRLKTYKIKNHDSGQTFRVKAVSYADAKMKYNNYILKDSLTEDAISKLVQNYLSSKKPKTKAEQDEIINFLLERNKITKEDVQKVRSLLKIVKDSITEDADLTGKIVKYNGMTVKVLRKLTEQEKQKRAHLNNPDAGDYYEVETTSKAIGTSKFIVWEARLRDSITEDAFDYDIMHKISDYIDRYEDKVERMSAKQIFDFVKKQFSNISNTKIAESLEYVYQGSRLKFAQFKDSITEDAFDYDIMHKISDYIDRYEDKVERMSAKQIFDFVKKQFSNISNTKIAESLEYVYQGSRLKFAQFKDSITEDADIAQNDIKSSYLPEDANADNIQYLGFNEKRKLSFYSYGDRYFVHHDLEGRTEEIDKATVQKILKKNILGEIDENDLINKEPQAEEIVSDAFTEDTTVADKLIGNGEVHFRYKGGRVITGAWNKNKLNEREISSILNKYNCKREQERWNDIVFSTRIGNEENLCKAFNEINPSYSVSELLSLHDSKERGDR